MNDLQAAVGCRYDAARSGQGVLPSMEDTRQLARRLAELCGVRHHFDALVKQVVASRRQLAHAKPIGAAAPRSQQAGQFEAELNDFEAHLRQHYGAFLEVQVGFLLRTMSAAELAEYVDAMGADRVQRYLAKSRAIQDQAAAVMSEFTLKIVREALARTH